MTQNLTTIGRAEKITLKEFGVHDIPAKIDTGADSSSIWASGISEENDELRFVLFAPGAGYYTGKVITLDSDHFSVT